MKSSYLKSTLQPGETILAKGRIHGAFLVAPAVVATAFLIGVLKLLVAWQLAELAPWCWWTALVPVLYFADRFIFWATAESAITSHRVLFKSGWIARKISEVSLSKIESSAIDEPLIGRVFGFADLVVKGSGGHAVTIPALANVMSFRAAVQNATNPA